MSAGLLNDGVGEINTVKCDGRMFEATEVTFAPTKKPFNSNFTRKMGLKPRRLRRLYPDG